MKTNFIVKFSVACPGLVIEATKFGWWESARMCGADPVVFGEFVTPGTSPSGERFAFAGTGRDLRDLCANARDWREVLEDRRFVVQPSKDAVLSMSAYGHPDGWDYKDLEWSGAPERAPR
jgi:hypothetical protein